MLVYGASSAVGLYVLQLAKASGVKTYALCSQKNFDLTKSFGADQVFNYHEDMAGDRIRFASGGKIQIAVDTIGEHGSVNIVVSAMSPEGGRIATIWPYSEVDRVVLGSKYVDVHSLAYDLVVDVRRCLSIVYAATSALMLIL